MDVIRHDHKRVQRIPFAIEKPEARFSILAQRFTPQMAGPVALIEPSLLLCGKHPMEFASPIFGQALPP